MAQILGVTEVRRQLHRLLISLRERPEQRYQIAVHGAIVAQLIAPPAISRRGSAASALLRLGRQAKSHPRRPARPSHVSEEHDRYLYGSKSARE